MPTPIKTAEAITGHRSKREKKIRQEAEAALLTGEAMQEQPDVRRDAVAHKEFLRLRQLFRAIGKDDAMYSQSINRYCLLYSECLALEARKRKMEAAGDSAADPKDSLAFYGLASDCDKKIMSKRKMMMDIEDKNLMNIQSSLRAAPKDRKPHESPLMSVLYDDDA